MDRASMDKRAERVRRAAEEKQAPGQTNGPRKKPDVELPEPPPWPESPNQLAFHGTAGEIVGLIEPQTEADPVAILAQILVMFGSLVGRQSYWQVEETRHYANLYCCLVGETAKGRKGTSRDRAVRAFDHVDETWFRRIVTGLSSGEGLIKSVADPSYKTHLVKVKGRVTDTQQVLDDKGVDDKRLLVVEPEFGRVLQAMGREGNTLSALLRAAWESGNLASLTKQVMRATGAHISLIGHITRIELQRLLTRSDAENGMANRILWLAVRRTKLLPMGGERIDLGPAGHKLALAAEEVAKRGCHELPLDASAREFWCAEAYPRLTAGTPGVYGAIIGRAEAQVRRLALLYALLDFRTCVGLSQLLAALALWDYCERSAKWIFGDSSGDDKADEILGALRAAGDKGMTQSEVRSLFSHHEPSKRIGEALALLVEGGQVRCEKTPTAGRSATKWIFTLRAKRE